MIPQGTVRTVTGDVNASELLIETFIDVTDTLPA